MTDMAFEELLTELYGEVNICGMTYTAGRALRSIDYVAFCCALNDYEDSQLAED